jgi:WhiB family redox-sensing transcriptional regulator
MLIDFLATLADYAAQNAWMDESLCSQIDPDLFFPEQGESPVEAKKVCRQCPVRAECLQAALDRGPEDFGVWGGTTRDQRRRMLRLGLAA